MILQTKAPQELYDHMQSAELYFVRKGLSIRQRSQEMHAFLNVILSTEDLIGSKIFDVLRFSRMEITVLLFYCII